MRNHQCSSYYTAVINKQFNFALCSSASYVGQEIILELTTLKQQNLASLWNSTTSKAEFTSINELQNIAKYQFDTNDYFGELISQTKSTQESYQAPLIGISFLSILMGAIVIPTINIPTSLKNILGLITLFGPLLFIGINIISPDFRIKMQSLSSEKNLIDKFERISYHEAGHFLSGYLLGVPVLGYDISGESDAGTMIASDFTLKNEDYKLNLDIVGALLIISMSGFVAESLRFGKSLGGSEDFSIAYSIMREYRVPYSQRDGYLRGGVMQALILMNKHRDVLDEVALAMRQNMSVRDCFGVIEKFGR